RYRGEGPEPPRAFLDGLVAQMRTARDPTSGFALDVGLVDEDWVVVECNEGFGLGLYDGLPAGDYADLVVARWRELIGAS
ncbi:MAG: ATP-grasp domain-containing protein, partial [Myxococcota bacterium]